MYVFLHIHPLGYECLTTTYLQWYTYMHTHTLTHGCLKLVHCELLRVGPIISKVLFHFLMSFSAQGGLFSFISETLTYNVIVNCEHNGTVFISIRVLGLSVVRSWEFRSGKLLQCWHVLL
jgi:hypothetical protein